MFQSLFVIIIFIREIFLCVECIFFLYQSLETELCSESIEKSITIQSFDNIVREKYKDLIVQI